MSNNLCGHTHVWVYVNTVLADFHVQLHKAIHYCGWLCAAAVSPALENMPTFMTHELVCIGLKEEELRSGLKKKKESSYKYCLYQKRFFTGLQVPGVTMLTVGSRL